jgi:dienelactone hydrolase
MRRVVIIVVLGALGLWLAAPYVSALALLIDLSGQDVALRRWLPVTPQIVTTLDVRVPTRHGPVDARVYVPAAPDGRTWLVIPGLHDGGVDEPRLARLTMRLAGEGIRIISLPLPDLREFRVVPRATDQIEDAALWALTDPQVTPNGTLGLVGVSFGGGLALVAAGRPTIADRIDRVISFGGHGDLPRVIEYLCTGVMPDGTARPAHDYGLAILLLGALHDLVPAEQVAPLDRGIRAFLAASMAAGRNLPNAAGLLEQARAIEQDLAEPARSIMRDVNARETARIGPLLRPLAESVGGAPALSPERSPVPQAQVFLIHGATDNVIPPSETSSLLHFYKNKGVPVHALLTPAVSHADPATGVSAVDVWHLLRMWVRITS